TEALRGFDMTLRRGEVVALLGPNGAGKTTAVRLLLGLLSPDAGRVRVLGRDPRSANARRRIGAMLQVARVPETLLVREHIALFRSYYPHPLPTAEIIRSAGLEDIGNRKFGDLSGGQRQRVLFGLALCGDPDLVLLDEPSVGMDLQSRRRLWQEVRALAAAGRSVLLTTHYLEEADALANRVIVIDQGRLIREGTPSEIKHGVSGRRIRCVTRLDPDHVRTLPSVISLERDRDAIVICAERPEEVVRRLLLEDESLHGLEVSAAPLEDAFLALTGGNRPHD
ncbi:MAG TPA: ABC transporter ATP-binding protein, partial [Steroidobacteraceae bacterium]|nr:ABC transporter ATP-binding protein [Steroidobacteraceae bacterium]